MNTNIIILLILAIIISFIVYKLYSDDSSTNVKPEPGCRGDQCPKFIECGVLSNDTIQKCDTNSDICKSCKCSGDSSLTGCMKCTVVDDSNPYYSDINQSDCVGNFEWVNGVCKLKNGSYCLPTKINDVNCNKFTGNKILTRLSDGTYGWRCICKNDTMFTNGGSGDCTDINVCGMLGSSENPSNISYRALINKNNNQLWSSSSDWNPFPGGVATCKCRDNEVVNDKLLTCMPNSCGQGTINPNNPESCKCPPTFVDCFDISYRDDGGIVYYTGICKLPSCVPDPCYPGRYDPTSNKCVCDVSKGYYNVLDTNSVFGQSCKQLCTEDNNPCGNRGDCYVYDVGSQNTNWTIVCATISPDGLSCGKGQGSLIYLGSDITKNALVVSGDFLSINQSGAGDKFIFEPICQDSNCPTGVSYVYPNDKYYIKTSDGKYIDFVNRKLTVDKNNNMMVQLYSKDDQVSKTKVSTQLYLVNIDSYVSSDQTNITVIKNFNGTMRCKNCRGGFVQDSQLLCEKQPTCSCKYSWSSAKCNVDSNNCGDPSLDPGGVRYSPNCEFGASGNLECDCVCR